MDERFSVPCLDGLRAIAILMVFLAHAGLYRWVPGGLGVTIFFFLSGYLITTLLRIESETKGKISIWDFYIRRAFRILPPMYVTILLVCISSALGIPGKRVDSDGLIATFLYVNNYVGLIRSHISFPIPAAWSLAIEEHFYLIFPVVFLFWIVKKTSRITQSRILLLSCLSALVWRFLLVIVCKIRIPMGSDLGLDTGWTYSATDCRFDAIAWGCLLAVRDNPWFAQNSSFISRYKGVFAALGVAAIVASLIWRNPFYRETFRYSLQSAALYPIFYYCVASPNSLGVRWLSWEPLRWVGWISYSLYLVHVLLLDSLHPIMSPVEAGITAFGLAVAYGWLMRLAVDLPSHKLRDKLLRSSIFESRSLIPPKVKRAVLAQQSEFDMASAVASASVVRAAIEIDVLDHEAQPI